MDWVVMRPVMEGLEGLITVQTEWSIDDFAEAHDALDLRDWIKEQAQKKLESKVNRGRKW